MSLQTDILAAFQRQAAKKSETDTPEQAQLELSQDLAAAIQNGAQSGAFLHFSDYIDGDISNGTGIQVFVVPPDWAGKNVVEFSVKALAGTGNVTVQLRKNGTSIGSVTLTASGSLVTATLSNTLAAGDTLRLNFSVTTFGLQTAVAVAKIE